MGGRGKYNGEGDGGKIDRGGDGNSDKGRGKETWRRHKGEGMGIGKTEEGWGVDRQG